MQLIADNINIMNGRVATALAQQDAKPITDLAMHLSHLGIQGIDLNPGPPSGQGNAHMALCLQAVQSKTGLPLWLDSNNPQILHQALGLCPNPAVINGFSLEPHKVHGILPLAVDFQVPIVGFLLHPDGHVPTGVEDRLQLASELMQVCADAGLPEDHLIIDPVLAPLIWDDGSTQAGHVLSFLHFLPDLSATPVQTVVGLSNLVSGLTHVAAPYLEAFYLSRLAEAGLSYALCNVQHKLLRFSATFSASIDQHRVLALAEFEPLLPDNTLS